MRRHIFTIAACIVVALIAAMGILLFVQESEVLFRLQELSLFLPTRLFYETSCRYPGGTLTWLGAYMTQFFYHPALGTALLAVAWMVIAGLCAWVFRLRRGWALFSALPPMALLAALVQTGYWMYCMKLQGHPWVPTLGILLSLVLQIPTILYKGRNAWVRLAWMTVVGIAGYPLMGAWSFLAVALLAVRHYADDTRTQRIVLPVAAVALVLIVPQVYYQWMYTQVEQQQVYLAAMPSFQYGTSDMGEFRWPYYAMALSFIPMILAGWLHKVRERWVIACAAICLGIGAWGVNARWYRDTNFRKEVVMTNQIERLDWEGVLRTMRSNDMGEKMPPTRLMVMMKNLALFRLGRAGDEMFRYPEGAEQYCLCGRHLDTQHTTQGDTIVHQGTDKDFGHDACPVRITQVGGKMLYYFYGKEQFCYRWCMEDGVEFGWNANVLKYMAKTSLITQDWNVAQKYIDMLKQTRYHRDWALKHEAMIRNPKAMEQNEEMVPILPMSQFPDRLDGDMTLVELYLLKTFSSGTGADRYYQEMTLICSLIMKDINLFWPRFLQYVNMHQKEENFRVPTHYQEAAYLYSMLEPNRPSQMWPGLTNAQAAEKIPFDQQVKQRYTDFMNFNTQCGSMSEEQKKHAFFPRFGDTFYYFYFLVRNQKTN